MPASSSIDSSSFLISIRVGTGVLLEEMGGRVGFGAGLGELLPLFKSLWGTTPIAENELRIAHERVACDNIVNF